MKVLFSRQLCEECFQFREDVSWSPTLQIFVCDECFTDLNDEIEDEKNDYQTD